MLLHLRLFMVSAATAARLAAFHTGVSALDSMLLRGGFTKLQGGSSSSSSSKSKLCMARSENVHWKTRVQELN
jgi:hypothetical protein